MRIKKINHRIAITIFSVLVLSLAAGFSLTYINLKIRFLEFSNRELTSALIPLEQSIVKSYVLTGSLDDIAKPRNWKRATKDLLKNRRPPNKNDPSHTYNKRPEEHKNPSWQQALNRTRNAFARNLTLFDTKQNRRAGGRAPKTKLTLQPIFYQDTLIGYLGYKKPGSFTQISQHIFLRQQSIHFALISAIVAVLSIFFANIISRRISQPLADLADTAKSLSNGHFDARIRNICDDEIGDICHTFNDMAIKLQQHETARRQWVADISHELRTPLAVLQAQAEALEDGVRPANKDNLNLLSSQIHTVNRLINDLYELSLSDLGALKYQFETLSLAELVEDFIDEHQQLSQEQGLRFTFHNQLPTTALIHGDFLRLRQLLSNIWQNSQRYTDNPGQLRWTVREAQDANHEIELIMEDSSPSVPANQLPHLFKRLYRVDPSRNRQTGGAGLGLAICQSICDSHQGKIIAEHSELGGVAIIFTVPRAAKEED